MDYNFNYDTVKVVFSPDEKSFEWFAPALKSIGFVKTEEIIIAEKTTKDKIELNDFEEEWQRKHFHYMLGLYKAILEKATDKNRFGRPL